MFLPFNISNYFFSSDFYQLLFVTLYQGYFLLITISNYFLVIIKILIFDRNSTISNSNKNTNSTKKRDIFTATISNHLLGMFLTITISNYLFLVIPHTGASGGPGCQHTVSE